MNALDEKSLQLELRKVFIGLTSRTLYNGHPLTSVRCLCSMIRFRLITGDAVDNAGNYGEEEKHVKL